MDRILPSFWLLGAVLYTAAALLLSQPFLDTSSGSLAATHETVVAKQIAPLDPPAILGPSLPVSEPVPLAETAAPASATESVSYPRNEWVAVIGYTAVVRAEPSFTAPVLTAYPIGQALRVVEREGDFARIQDLSSGHYGWVATSSIAARLPGYREREAPLFPPTLVAQTEPSAETPKVTAPKVAQPSTAVAAVAVRPKRETVAVAEPSDPPLVTRASLKPQHVAENQANGGVAALVERAFSGY
jgi:hypothetical protein